MFALVTPVHAFLINRGTDTLGNRLIYDDDFDITWYDFTKAVDTWANQIAWADTLSVDFGGDIFDDWRLPTALNQDSSGPFSGFHDPPTTVITSEMAHLYYTELDIDDGGNLNNPDNFQNLISASYWSSTESAANPTNAWCFNFNVSNQTTGNKLAIFSGLAVRSGDVAAAAVPEPTTVVLLGMGLAGIAIYGVRRRRQRK